jgi:hypothetical protein
MYNKALDLEKDAKQKDASPYNDMAVYTKRTFIIWLLV